MIDAETEILGLIGYPLEHSLSPRLHNYYLHKLDLNYVYLPFAVEPERLKTALEGLKALNFRGINVTIPYKERIIPFLDELDPLAQKMGAVNTVVNEENCLIGYNTDAGGFVRMLREDGEFTIEQKRAVIIGAGGASRSVGFGLCRHNIAEILLINRTISRAEQLASLWREHYPGVKISTGGLEDKGYRELFQKFQLLVDTTPVGMEPEVNVPPVISPDYLHGDLLVVDLVYNPLETTLLKTAKQKGARTLNGLGMLLYQGIESFYLWTGEKPEDTGLREDLLD